MDTVIELADITNLIITEQMKCLVMSTAEQCSITIKLTKDGPTSIRLLNGATIEGKFIIIDSPNTGIFIDNESRIIAGGSYKHKGSAEENEPMRGASFVGQGGYCGTEENINYRVYGKFDMNNDENPWDPDNFQVGSMADWIRGDKGTAGGGYIYINVDSTHFDGDSDRNTIEANGWPLASSSKRHTYHGGSGGYIYIKTANIYGKHNNADSTSWRISAQGGNGKLDGFGGSGGIIIVDGNFAIT